MTKICPKCLKLVPDSDICLDCGAASIDIESWRSTRSASSMKSEVAPPSVAWIGSASFPVPLDAGRLQNDNPMPKMTEAEVEPAAVNSNQPMDWTKFVLGVFISCLVFFCTFLAAYVASGAAE